MMEKNKKYAFFGSPEFAAIILGNLIASGYPPSLVICNPDKPKGRKKVLTPPPTKSVAEKNNIPVWQPDKLDPQEFTRFGKFDFAVIAAYSKIIKPDILDSFPLGVIGVHPSLLPKYRGASPIQFTILSGDKETGVTLYLVDDKVDHGPIIDSEKLIIEKEDDYTSLLSNLASLGSKLLIKTIPLFTDGDMKLTEQDHAQASFTKKISREDGFIDPEEFKKASSGIDPELAQKLDRRVKALNPEPGAWTLGSSIGEKPEKQVKILRSEVKEGRLKPRLVQVEGKTPRDI